MKWLTAEKWYPASCRGGHRANTRKMIVIGTLLLLVFVILHAGFIFYNNYKEDELNNKQVALQFNYDYMPYVGLDLKVQFEDVTYVVRDIPETETRVKVLYEPAPEFSEMMRGAFPLLPVVFGACVLSIILNYRSYRKPVKTVYLMKRLPDRGEMHRQCLILPIAELVLHILVCAAVSFVCYLIYRHYLLPGRLPEHITFNVWRTFSWWN